MITAISGAVILLKQRSQRHRLLKAMGDEEYNYITKETIPTCWENLLVVRFAIEY